jgi:ribosome modulation factor
VTNVSLEYTKQFIQSIPTSNEKIAWAMGYDYGMNGADEKNCHFSLFSSHANMKAWEAGKKQAEADKEKKGGK